MPSTSYDDDGDNATYNANANADEHSDSRGEHFIEYKPKYYPTKLGRQIVNAITGSKYPYIQGSFEELRLYKIVDVTATCDEHGVKLPLFSPANRTPNFLYYDSPEQGMRHLKLAFSYGHFNKWHEDRARMFPNNGIFVREAWDEITKNTTYKKSGSPA